MRWSVVVLSLCIACGDNAGIVDGCDDGIFCNGIERIVDGKCVKSPANPCDDGADCTIDTCVEATQRCAHELTAGCAACRSEQCTPDCTGRECGDDACGGLCGSCGANKGCTPDGLCADATALGTCAAPRTITPMIGQSQTLQGDTSNSVHQTVPTCNATSTAVEEVWKFTVATTVGVEIQTHGYDTVLSLRKEDPNTAGNDCLDDTNATVDCSDDSAPPGDFGSRVSAVIAPGTYYVIVDGFDATQSGPYEMKIKFADNCLPSCDGQFCGGDDGCGNSCGSCANGEACGPDLRCRPDPCVPNCMNEDGTARTCGDDGCLGTCGECEGGALCVPLSGTCQSFAECDHQNPVCGNGCQTGHYCGSDCECHFLSEALPDLVINEQRLNDEVLFDHVVVSPSSCSLAEQCVDGMGRRRVMRFSVEAINQGQATMHVQPPDERPDLFTFSTCHGHFHFDGFALYELLDGAGNVVQTGRKQAFCMEDTIQVHQGPNVGCNKEFDCFTQGIQPGWSDLYGNALDCQWLDITDTAPGNYQLRVTVNPGRTIQEVSFDNNVATIPVTIAPE